MDSYVDTFQANGGSMIMLAKGNRSKQVKHKDIIILIRPKIKNCMFQVTRPCLIFCPRP